MVLKVPTKGAGFYRENTHTVYLRKKRCFNGGVIIDNEVICKYIRRGLSYRHKPFSGKTATAVKQDIYAKAMMMTMYAALARSTAPLPIGLSKEF
jgi:hypothetical protein